MHTQRKSSAMAEAIVNGESASENSKSNGSNKRKAGASDEMTDLQETVARSLTTMLYRTYLRPSSVHQHVSPRDMEIKYEAKKRRELRGISYTKRFCSASERRCVFKFAEERDADWDVSGTTVSLGPDGLAADHRETRRGLMRKKQSAIAVANAASKSKRSKSSSEQQQQGQEEQEQGKNGVNARPL